MTPKPEKNPPHWDVSKVYPGLSSSEYQADFERLNTSLEALLKYLDDNQIQKNSDGPAEKDPEKLAKILDYLIGQMNALIELSSTLRAYITAFTATDSYNAEGKKAFSNWE